MNIVIYGCDNTGKSHLAEALEKAFNGIQIHSLGNVPIEKQMEFMDNEILPKGSKYIKIFDRFPIIEEEVYGTLLRGGSKYDYNPSYKNDMLDKIDLFIYAYPGLLSVLNWNGREQMDGVIDNVIKIINEYNKLTYNFIRKRRVLEFNYNCDSEYKNIISKVREVINEYNRG